MMTSAICGRSHLFERFGPGGLDTNIARDDDRYFAGKLQQIGFPEWNDVSRYPCHTLIPAAGKYVLQYPPGPGFVLSLFPSGFQVIPLYVLATVVVAGFAGWPCAMHRHSIGSCSSWPSVTARSC